MREFVVARFQTLPSPPLEELQAPIAAALAEMDAVLRAELVCREPLVRELCAHVERYRGKQLRPTLLLLTGAACGRLSPEHPLLAAVVELVHLATLVHDDVLDDGQVRRQAVTVNRLWGAPRAVLLGDILFSHAYRLCSRLDSQYAADVIARTAVTVCEGELVQIANRGNLELSEEAYLEVVGAKTGALLGACALLGARYAGAPDETCRRMQHFGLQLGTAFQIIDDLLDLTGEEGTTGKTLRRDAEHGELTLPLIHYLRSSPPAERAAMMTALRGPTPQRAARVVELLDNSSSIVYARQCAEAHGAEALETLEQLPSSEARQCLRATVEFVLARQY